MVDLKNGQLKEETIVDMLTGIQEKNIYSAHSASKSEIFRKSNQNVFKILLTDS